LVNSGSSANLTALSALTSRTLGEKRISAGDEVITVAAGFPTTVNPIIQNNAIPVFLDVDIPSYNMKIDDLEKAVTKKTKAIMIAHTLGNPFQLDKIVDFCKSNNLWLIEDNCDSLGSKFQGKLTGSFGDISTLSFYPAHHQLQKHLLKSSTKN
jgi:CDP-6-deoxy-D-xylo-4-hexulose-3-dehydrase